ncbi:MAG TPA: antibiotic biosynthesis monooxygenase [Acidimicrobiales bacterium]|nr:antibiotic biosynthesis monooxygenase [Acidimicrobiales bacterium]
MSTPTELTVSFVAKLVAKSEMAEEVSELLASAAKLAADETTTPVWFALRTDPVTFWIVDAFASEADRQAHLAGPIAAALMANADRLLATPPEIMPADVLAAKIPAAPRRDS